MPPFRPSENIARIKESATLAVAAKSRALKAAGVPVIDLGAGEPDFDTPPFIRDAAVAALEAGATRYTATEGILPLREAIAASASAGRSASLAVSPSEIVVSNGSKQSLFNACTCLFGPGDEVLVPSPAWTSYYEMVELARATAVPVFGTVEHSLKVTVSQLEAAATDRTRGLMLCTPSNPTGAVYGRDELGAILDLAASRGWWVLCDEIYLRIAYERPASSALDVVSSRDNLVVISGVAKAYAMTGWRIGWTIAPPEVTKAMIAFQSHTTSNAASVSQHAALAALSRHDEAEAAITAMTREFRRRRDAALETLAAYPRIRYVHPEGAFYLYINVGDWTPGDDPGGTFSARLLEEQQVAVVPGNAFLTPEWIRASYATSLDIVVEGIGRIARCLTT